MSKKSEKKRTRQARERQFYPRGAPTSTTVRDETSAPAPELEVETAHPEQEAGVDFAAEYQYVREDLKRIAILASTFFAILIVLSFVL